MSFLTTKPYHPPQFLPIKELLIDSRKSVELTIPEQPDPLPRNPSDPPENHQFDIIVVYNGTRYILTAKNGGKCGLADVYTAIQQCFGHPEWRVRLSASLKRKHYIYQASIVKSNEQTPSASPEPIAGNANTSTASETIEKFNELRDRQVTDPTTGTIRQPLKSLNVALNNKGRLAIESLNSLANCLAGNIKECEVEIYKELYSLYYNDFMNALSEMNYAFNGMEMQFREKIDKRYEIFKGKHGGI